MKQHHDPQVKSFASDNYASVHPEILKSIEIANGGHATAYGADGYSAHLTALAKANFTSETSIYPVFNGTGANIVGLSAILKKYQGVITLDNSHINVDEGGASERLAGIKLLLIPPVGGKATTTNVARQARNFDDIHRVQPGALSITQSTELGTVYSISELKELKKFCKETNLLLHIDGARIFNALSALGSNFKELIVDCGVDVLSLGGTKNGVMGAEAIVVLNPSLNDAMERLRKSSMQLSSKMRYISAQLITLLENDLGITLATHANAMAALLYQECKEIEEIRFERAPQVNSLFVTVDPVLRKKLQEKYHFYVWDEPTNLVRWMTSWDTQEKDVLGFVAHIKDSIARG